MSLRFSQNTLTGCCGVQVVYNLYRHGGTHNSTLFNSGTGYYISTFNELQKEEYLALCKIADIVYQSKPRRNKNSGRRVFIVIWTRKKK